MQRARLVLILFAASPIAFAVQDCELNGEYVNPANGHTTAGRTGVMKCRDRDTGELARERELRAGKFVGLERFYNRDGKLEREHRINERGNRDGLAREFFPDGRVAREETYRNGRTFGIGRNWHPNGALKRIVVRGDDGREIAEAEFNDRGQLQDLRCADRPVMGLYVDDKALCGHGARKPVVSELYSDKGEVRGRVAHLAGQMTLSESLWDNGKLRDQREIGEGNQVERRFSREGVKRHETRWATTGQSRTKELEQEFHESGNLVRERHWQAGELASEKTWYLNGRMKADYRYARRDGRRSVCDVSEFHDNGEMAGTGTYLMSYGYPDRPVGTVRGFDRDGRLRKEVEYDPKGRLKRERELDEKGVVLRDDAVFEDGSRKAFAAEAPR
ncbi:MAG: hypothetical protein KJ634_11200 [Gammaproteobacteria bacterium]|nr:hypothetical protein [Gammaproteobacteria bacterium]MBU1416180.1 hypothetical protein [Gammaproteobacteria bacterium]